MPDTHTVHEQADWNPFGFTPGCELMATELPIMSVEGGFALHTDTGITLAEIWQEGGVFYVKINDVDGKMHSGIFLAEKFVLA